MVTTEPNKQSLRRDPDQWIRLGRKVKAIRQAILTLMRDVDLLVTAKRKRGVGNLVRKLNAEARLLENEMRTLLPGCDQWPDAALVFYGECETKRPDANGR